MKRERLESLVAKHIVQLAAYKKREHPIEAYKAIVQLRIYTNGVVHTSQILHSNLAYDQLINLPMLTMYTLCLQPCKITLLTAAAVQTV